MVRESEPERSGRGPAELSGAEQELRQRGTHFKLEERDWAMVCLGIGECGGKIVRILNKKPEGLPSRHPDYYPVLCAVFDTDTQAEKLKEVEPWKGKPDVPFYYVPSLEATAIQERLASPSEPSATPSGPISRSEIASYLERAGGAGGVHILGRMYFQAFMEGERDDRPIKQYADDLQFGEQVGSIGRIGLLTVNSIRGGSGSGGAPFIAQFLSRYLKVTPKFSLNVSILPTLEERRTKPLFAAHAMASLFHMQSKDVDGVILVHNQVLQDRFEGHTPYQQNFVIHEMLAPFFYCPLTKRNRTDLAPVVDPYDIHNSVRLGIEHTSLCTMGFGKMVWSDGAIANDRERVLQELAQEAVDNTSAKCKFYPWTTFTAMLTAPPSFYRGIGAIHPKDTLSKYLREAIVAKLGNEGAVIGGDLADMMEQMIRRRQTSSNRPEGEGAVIGGQVGLLHQEAAKSVQLSVIFSSVQCDELDAVVKEALGESRYNTLGGEGWTCLHKITHEEVEKIAREELKRVFQSDRR